MQGSHLSLDINEIRCTRVTTRYLGPASANSMMEPVEQSCIEITYASMWKDVFLLHLASSDWTLCTCEGIK